MDWIAQRGEVSRRQLSEHEAVRELSASDRHGLEARLREHSRVEVREHGITHVYTTRPRAGEAGGEAQASDAPPGGLGRPNEPTHAEAAEVVAFDVLPPPVVVRSCGRRSRRVVGAIAMLALGLAGVGALSLRTLDAPKSAASGPAPAKGLPLPRRAPQPRARQQRLESRQDSAVPARGGEATPVARSQHSGAGATIRVVSPPERVMVTVRPAAPRRPSRAPRSTVTCPLRALTIGC